MIAASNGLQPVPTDLGALSALAAAPELAGTFVTLLSDIALVIDGDGVIRNVAQSAGHPMAPGAQHWVGRSWADTVSGDTRPKVEKLLREASATGLARRREINQLSGTDSSVPVAYTAIRLGAAGPVLAVGRDLRAAAAIQQRHVESLQEMERGHWQARQAEARFQLLFQAATDAVLVVDGENLQIVEANQAATSLFATTAGQLGGRAVNLVFEPHSRGAVDALMRRACSTGRGGETRARMRGCRQDGRGSIRISATPFQIGSALRLLVRVRAEAVDDSTAALDRTLARLVGDSRDGVVVTDAAGRVEMANPAFLELAGLRTESLARGQPLARWLTLTRQPLAALLSDLIRDGVSRRVETVFRAVAGAATAVELSATLLTEGSQERIGFTVHTVTRTPVGLAPQRQAADALTTVLRAGIEALGPRLEPARFAALLHDAGAALGVSADALRRRIHPEPPDAAAASGS